MLSRWRCYRLPIITHAICRQPGRQQATVDTRRCCAQSGAEGNSSSAVEQKKRTWHVPTDMKPSECATPFHRRVPNPLLCRHVTVYALVEIPVLVAAMIAVILVYLWPINHSLYNDILLHLHQCVPPRPSRIGLPKK